MKFNSFICDEGAPSYENEIIVDRKQISKYSSGEHGLDFDSVYDDGVISREEYLKLLNQKKCGINYIRNTFLIFYKKDSPGILFIKAYRTTCTQIVSKRGVYTKKKNRTAETLSFNMEKGKVVFRLYTKLGKIKQIFFKSNQSALTTLMEFVEEFYDDNEFFDIISKELNINPEGFSQNFLNLKIENKINAFTLYFLLYKKGFDFTSLLSTDLSDNLQVNILSKHLKHVKSGYDTADILQSLYPNCDGVSLGILMKHPFFINLCVDNKHIKINKILTLFNIKPKDLIIDGMTCEWIIGYYPQLILVGKIGYKFSDIKRGITSNSGVFSEFMAVLLFFDRLDLNLGMDLQSMLRYIDEYKILIRCIKKYMITESIFYPLNLNVAKKLAHKDYTFMPEYKYDNTCYSFLNNIELYQTYTVMNNANEPVATLLLSEIQFMFVKYCASDNITNLYNTLITHISHKTKKTKILEFVDFKILLNKLSLRSFIEKTINDRYTKLINW